MSGDDITTLRVFLLAAFDDDEKEQISNYLIGDKENIEIEWNDCGYEDGTAEANIQEAYKLDAADVMFFVDREDLANNSYVVADGRCIRQPWYCDLVLTHYGFENTEGWELSEDAANIFENHAVPWSRFDALGKWDVLDIWTSYETDAEYSILDSLNSEGDAIYVSYSADDEEDVVNQLKELGIGNAVDEAEEGGEAEEEEAEAEEEAEEEGEEEEGGEEEEEEEAEEEEGEEETEESENEEEEE